MIGGLLGDFVHEIGFQDLDPCPDPWQRCPLVVAKARRAIVSWDKLDWLWSVSVFFLEMCFLGFLKGEELVKCFEMPRCLLCQQNVRHLESQRRCG